MYAFATSVTTHVLLDGMVSSRSVDPIRDAPGKGFMYDLVTAIIMH